ncbi:metallophosphoesterase [Pseudomonas putida]
MARPVPRRRPRPWRRLRTGVLIALLGSIVCALGGAGWVFYYPISPYLPITGLDPTHLSIMALGDQGNGSLRQWRVAHAMETIAERDGRLDLVALLGDNFYGKPLSGVEDAQWQTKFEKVYTGHWLSHVPFYAVLGNHDCPLSRDAELAYARQHVGSGRFQMPASTYTRDFGQVDGRPLLRVVFFDSEVAGADLGDEVQAMEQAFEQPGPTPIWRMVTAHHPLRSASDHDPDSTLAAALLPTLLRQHVDLYVSGHDHSHQLLLRPGEPAWVISGGGGQKLNPLFTATEPHAFAASEAGFVKLDLDASHLDLVFYNEFADATAHFTWQRDCPWLANGCLRNVVLANNQPP